MGPGNSRRGGGCGTKTSRTRTTRSRYSSAWSGGRSRGAWSVYCVPSPLLGRGGDSPHSLTGMNTACGAGAECVNLRVDQEVIATWRLGWRRCTFRATCPMLINLIKC